MRMNRAHEGMGAMGHGPLPQWFDSPTLPFRKMAYRDAAKPLASGFCERRPRPPGNRRPPSQSSR